MKRREFTGATRTPIYHVWRTMVDRCQNPNAKDYADYGGRGITVCDRWRNSVAAFLEDMSPRPPFATIERIDNGGPYSPSNCKWASRREQGNNKRNNRVLAVDGRSLTVAQWAAETGIPYARIHARLRLGWPAHLAVSKGLLYGKRNQLL